MKLAFSGRRPLPWAPRLVSPPGGFIRRRFEQLGKPIALRTLGGAARDRASGRGLDWLRLAARLRVSRIGLGHDKRFLSIPGEARSRFRHNRSVRVDDAIRTFGQNDVLYDLRRKPRTQPEQDRIWRASGPCRAVRFRVGRLCAATGQHLETGVQGLWISQPTSRGLRFRHQDATDRESRLYSGVPAPPEPSRPTLKTDELKAVKSDLELGREAPRHASTRLSAGRQGVGRATGGAKKSEFERSRRPAIANIRFAAFRLPMLQHESRRIGRRSATRPKANGCDERFSPGAALAALCFRAGQ